MQDIRFHQLAYVGNYSHSHLLQVARRLRLHNCSQYRNSSGGAAIEDMAQNGNPFAFLFSAPLQSYKNCNFSFSGMKSQAMRYIETEERRYGLCEK